MHEKQLQELLIKNRNVFESSPRLFLQSMHYGMSKNAFSKSSYVTEAEREGSTQQITSFFFWHNNLFFPHTKYNSENDD